MRWFVKSKRGPFRDNTDTDRRGEGMDNNRAGSLAEAKQKAGPDPMYNRGRRH